MSFKCRFLAVSVWWVVFLAGFCALICRVEMSYALKIDLPSALDTWYQWRMPQQEGEDDDFEESLKKQQSHPEWSWLPAYKWDELSSSPYTAGDRLLDVVGDHALPLFSLAMTAEFSRRADWLGRWVAGCGVKRARDLAWRLGDLVGDVVTSHSSNDLIWRQFVSNLDLFQLHHQGWSSTVFYGVKRSLAYLPLLYSVVPEILWETGVVGPGRTSIRIEPEALGKRVELSFEGARAERDTGAPPFAHIDMDILPTASALPVPETHYERLLIFLDETCRRHGVTRIRFYGAKNEQAEGDMLNLFVRLFVQNRPGPLIRFPLNFGRNGEVDWWTTALDSRTLQGVYNRQDQFQVVQLWNHVKGYGGEVANPLSENVLASLPHLIESMINAQDSEFKTGRWGEEEWSYVDYPMEDAVDSSSFAAFALPRQSSHHTLINGGESGAFFVDDHLSRRVEWPRLSLLTRAHFGQVSSSTLVGLEMHLPWLPVRGSARIAANVANNLAYAWVSRMLLTWRDQMAGEFPNPYEDPPEVPEDQAVTVDDLNPPIFPGDDVTIPAAEVPQPGEIPEQNNTSRQSSLNQKPSRSTTSSRASKDVRPAHRRQSPTLLDQIRQGKQLKDARQRPLSKVPPPPRTPFEAAMDVIQQETAASSDGSVTPIGTDEWDGPAMHTRSRTEE